MAKTRLQGLLEKKIAVFRQETLESIGSGVCHDHGAYRDQCGYLRGLDDALKMLDDLSEENQ